MCVLLWWLSLDDRYNQSKQQVFYKIGASISRTGLNRPSTALFLNTVKHAVAVENTNTIYNTNQMQILLNPVDGQQKHKHKYTTNHSRAAQILSMWLPQLGIFVLQIYKLPKIHMNHRRASEIHGCHSLALLVARRHRESLMWLSLARPDQTRR